DRRPDALAAKFVKAPADRREKAEQEPRAKPWPALVDEGRQGPPQWNALRLEPAGEAVDSGGVYVHHEHLRRAAPGWQPRPSDPAREEGLWRALSRVARMIYGRSPVGVVLRRPDGTEIAAKRGPRTVRVIGEPSELILHAFGRKELQVTFEGNEADVLAMEDLRR